MTLQDRAATSAYTLFAGYHHDVSDFSPSLPSITVHPDYLPSLHRPERLSCQPSAAVCIVIARTLRSPVQSTCESIRKYDKESMECTDSDLGGHGAQMSSYNAYGA